MLKFIRTLGIFSLITFEIIFRYVVLSVVSFTVFCAIVYGVYIFLCYIAALMGIAPFTVFLIIFFLTVICTFVYELVSEPIKNIWIRARVYSTIIEKKNRERKLRKQEVRNLNRKIDEVFRIEENNINRYKIEEIFYNMRQIECRRKNDKPFITSVQKQNT